MGVCLVLDRWQLPQLPVSVSVGWSRPVMSVCLSRGDMSACLLESGLAMIEGIEGKKMVAGSGSKRGRVYCTM